MAITPLCDGGVFCVLAFFDVFSGLFSYTVHNALPYKDAACVGQVKRA